MPGAPESFLVWGAGGHGKVVADVLRSAGYRLAGFVDRDAKRISQTLGDGTIVETEDELFAGLANGSLPRDATAVALGIGDNGKRWQAFESLAIAVAPPLIHPGAVCADSVVLGDGSVVMAGAVINPDCEIGRAVIINSGAIVEHDCTIEDAAHISPGAVLTGSVQVGRGAWIGAACTVLPGIRVGAGAIVGAGAVVTSDLPENCTAVGIPARPIKTRTEKWNTL